ncbi:MAG: YwaF family protein [Oscillospiraceae bacterium]|nr:YwaF family protein [Oscillospiraceae bacterium]
MTHSDAGFWIIRPFNPVFCIVFAAFLLLLIVAGVLLRGKSDRTKRTVIVVACVLTLIGFFVYKYCLSIDAEFDRLTANMGGFNWWGELPVQLCNINMILIPIAVLLDSRPLMSFCFFLGPLGAMMALVMPGTGFDGYSLLLPRMLGYYGTHFMIVIEALALAVFGLFRPRFRDLPKMFLTIFLIALAVFGFNMLLRVTGLHPKANYFFSVETEGNFVLELFHKWIPVPFLYLLPSFVILLVYASIIILGFDLADRIKRRKKDAVAV